MLDPRARGIAAALAIIGTFAAQDPVQLGIGCAIVLLLMAATRILVSHLRFVVSMLLPVAFLLFAVWGWWIGAPPGQPVGSNHHGGLMFALAIVLRLQLFSGIIQLCLQTIPAERMLYTLSRCGVRGDAMIILLGAIAVVPEITQRADQVFTARFALGAAGNRSLATRARQLPHMLRPLFASALRSAIHRAESWRQRQIFARVEDFSAEGDTGSVVLSVLCVGLAASWLAASIILRVWWTYAA